MSFGEVRLHEIREVLRLWLRGEGYRAVARLSTVDRKTVRRYVEAAMACGLDRDGGEDLTDEPTEPSRRPARNNATEPDDLLGGLTVVRETSS